MASIAGLSTEQCEQLQGVQEGDLILLEIRTVHIHDEDGGEVPNDNSSHLSEQEEMTEGDEIENNGESEVEASEEMNEDADYDADMEMGESEAEAADPRDEDADYETDEEMGESEFQESDGSDMELPTTLFQVVDITKDDNNIITDLRLQRLTYCLKPAENGPGSFQIYGSDITVHNTPDTGDTVHIETESMTALSNDPSKRCNICSGIRGEDILREFFSDTCPASCIDGWVATQQQMHELVEDDMLLLPEHRPVCPVCIGKDLMQQYQSLRSLLDIAGPVDLGTLVEFYGVLNPRRQALGYSFKQFDEREWGYLFDDMQSENEEGNDDAAAAGNAGWEYYSEALDPASGLTATPASDSAVAALPRKTFAAAKRTDEEVICQVCRETFQDDTVVAELPCGHFFCNEGCTEMWLKQSASCPVCRYRLPLKDNEEKKATSGNDAVDGDNSEISTYAMGERSLEWE